MKSMIKIYSLIIICNLCFPVWLSAQSIQLIQQPQVPNCKENKPDPLSVSDKNSWNGWGNSLEQLRYQPADIGGIKSSDLKKLKLKWAYGIPGATKVDAQPTVIGNWIFTSGGTNKIQAIDAKTGCQIWNTSVGARVRSTIIMGTFKDQPLLFFGDQNGIAYALEPHTGKKIWAKKLDEHPFAQITGSPAYNNDVVYFPVSSGMEEGIAAGASYECCTFRGSVSALSASTGEVIWKTYTIKNPARKNSNGKAKYGPSGSGIWSAPTIDLEKRKIYVTTGNNFSNPATETSDAILSLSMDTGELNWSKQITKNDSTNTSCYEQSQENCPNPSAPDHDFASSAVLIKIDSTRRMLIAGQKSGVVTAIDPDNNGEILWQRKIGNGSPQGGIQFGIASDGRKIYAANSFIQSLPSNPSTPGAQLGQVRWYILGSRGGGMTAIDLISGEISWHTKHPGCNGIPGCSQAQSAAVTATDAFVLSGGLDGVLRAYDSATGEIIWSVDTKVLLKGSNGITVKGGSLDGPGAVIVGGAIYINSGYQMWGGIPGNALLCFSLTD